MHISNITRETLLTEKVVETLGFVHKDYGDDPPYDAWGKDGIEIWNFNDEYWLIDALDQAGITNHLTTVGQLLNFFIGCGLSLSLGEALTEKQQEFSHVLKFIQECSIHDSYIAKPVDIVPVESDAVRVTYTLKKNLTNSVAEEETFQRQLADIISMLQTHVHTKPDDFCVNYSVDSAGGLLVSITGLVK